MTKTSFSYDQAATQIASYGWANASTTPITYGFRSSDASDPGFVRFSSVLISAADQAMALWSDVANIKFQKVGTGTTGEAAYTDNATMLFAGDVDSGGYGWTYFPGDRSASSIDGNVYLNTSGGNFANLSNGNYEFMALIHEIGHGLGLDHPGAYNGGNPTYALNAEYLQDSRQYTVMSYFDAEETGAVHGWNFAATPLLHDIAAIQKLYGANTSARADDTVYGFNSTANRQQFNIASANQKVVFAIWDGGGDDTLNFSGYLQNSKIDLRGESFSDVGGLVANVAIARGVAIENAIGGGGNDTITGNGLANTLTGGAGSDDLKGGAGNDHLNGGAGNDTIELTGARSEYTFWLAADGSIVAGDHQANRDGYDTVSGVENVHFTDGSFLIANLLSAGTAPDPSTWGTGSGGGTTTTPTTPVTPPNTTPGTETKVPPAATGADPATDASTSDLTITGTSAADTCTGGGGDDVLMGLAGRDALDGGAGFDVLVGGGGKDLLTGGSDGDVFEFDSVRDSGRTGGTRDVILDFHHNDDAIDLYGIDANTRVGGDQDFSYIGRQGFHGIAGELHAIRLNFAGTARDKTIIEGDVNGDGRADFQIELSHLVTLTKADFIL